MTSSVQKTNSEAEQSESISWELLKKVSDELLERNKRVYEELAK